MDTQDNNRLLMAVDKAIREINRRTINPLFPGLKLNDISPVIECVAKARGLYLKALFEMTVKDLPSAEQVTKLRQLRETYEELVAGTQALETAIKRGYLDVVSTR